MKTILLILVLIQVVPCEVRPVESTGTEKVGNSQFVPGVGWQAPKKESDTRSLAIENRETAMRVVDAISDLEAEVDRMRVELDAGKSFPWMKFIGCGFVGGAVGTAVVLVLLFYVSVKWL